MGQIRDHSTPYSDDKDLFEKWKALLSEPTYDEVYGDEPIVTTLYAKPSTDNPFLTLAKLKNGIYEETSYMGLRSYILFSDIGRAIWDTALELNRNSTIELVKASMLEEDKAWQVMIRNQDLTVLVNSVRLKPIGKYPSAFYVSIEISSKPAPLMAFVKGVMEALNRKPWENQSGELNWGKFAKKTSTPRNEVIEQWALLSGSPELSPEGFEETVEPVCWRCKKTMEKGWVLCPFCGEPLKDHFNGH